MMICERLTTEKVLRAAKRMECVGFCIACGRKATGVEPDACEYECEYCERRTVFGAEEILLMMH